VGRYGKDLEDKNSNTGHLKRSKEKEKVIKKEKRTSRWPT
jgi:hypothetical protein